MNDTVWIALFTMIGTSIASTVAAVLAYLKSRDSLAASANNGVAIKDLHVIVNDRLTKLLETTAAKEHAEGHAEGVAAELQRGTGEAARLAVALQTPPPGGSAALAANTAATIENTRAIDAEPPR